MRAILLSVVVLHGRLIALAHSARSFALALVDSHFQSVPLLARPKKQNKMLLAACGADLKNKILVQDEFNQSLPRPSTLSTRYHLPGM